MADDERDEVEVGAEGNETEEKAKSSKDLQQQSKALDSITDHVEERQLDSKRVQQAMAAINASAEANRNAQRLREKELASVAINSEHIDVIASEVEVDRQIAERKLREFKGDAVAALRSFLQ